MRLSFFLPAETKKEKARNLTGRECRANVDNEPNLTTIRTALPVSRVYSPFLQAVMMEEESIVALPDELLSMIFKYRSRYNTYLLFTMFHVCSFLHDIGALVRVSMVCRRWRAVVWGSIEVCPSLSRLLKVRNLLPIDSDANNIWQFVSFRTLPHYWPA